MHKCPADRCEVQVKHGHLMCREHWAMAAFDLKYFVKSACYGPGIGSPEHQEACDRAIADVNAKLSRS